MPVNRRARWSCAGPKPNSTIQLGIWNSAKGTVTMRLAFNGPCLSCSLACKNPVQPISSARLKNKIKSSSCGNTTVNSSSHFSTSAFSGARPKIALAHNTVATGTPSNAMRYHWTPTRHHEEGRQRHAEDVAERIVWGQIERQDVAPCQNRHQRDRGVDGIDHHQEGGHRMAGHQTPERRVGSGLLGCSGYGHYRRPFWSGTGAVREQALMPKTVANLPGARAVASASSQQGA